MIKKNALMTLGNKLKSWAAWDEASQDTLATNQGGGADNLFLCFHDAPNAGDDDVGVGLVTGADLVLTQVGNVPGATGTPPSRDLTGDSDYFQPTANLLNSFLATDNWLILIKAKDIDEDTLKMILRFDQDAVNFIELRQTLTDYFLSLNIRSDDNGQNTGQLYTTNPMSAGTRYYIAVWNDGSKVYFGFTTTRPTKLSDFTAGNYVDCGDVGNFAGIDFSRYKDLYGYGTPNDFVAKVYYVLFSKNSQTIIDNAS